MVAGWKRACLICLFILLAGLSVHPADGSIETSKIKQASLETLLATRRAMLKSKWQQLGQVEQQARELVAAEAQAPILWDGDLPPSDRLDDMVKRATRFAHLAAERVRLLNDMQDIQTEITSLQAEMDRVKASLERGRQVMQGRWTIVLMPMGTKGDVYFSQNGTILSGDYQLDNGQMGNLQGIFVKDAVSFERIDSAYGKMGKLEGSVSKDRLTIRGTWYAYDLSSGQAVSGAFAMDKVQEDQTP